jgi:hypothetical protein
MIFLGTKIEILNQVNFCLNIINTEKPIARLSHTENYIHVGNRVDFQ